MTRAPVAVLGLGNELFTDEGVGVEAARRVGEVGLPGVDVLDGGTLGITLLPEIADRDALLVIDAVVGDGLAPGDIVRLDRDELSRANLMLFSAHQLGLPETLLAAGLMGRAPGAVAGIGVVPGSLETGYGLSPEIEARLGEVVAIALEILAGWGVEVPAHA